jgi:hypothetical protein
MVDQKPQTERASEEEQGIELVQTLTYGKLAFLGIIAMALSSFGFLFVFAPVPLALAILLYGRTKGAVLAVGATVLFTAMAVATSQAFPWAAGTFLTAYLYAVLISEVIFRGIGPKAGLVAAGSVVLLLTAGLVGGYLMMKDVSVRDLLTTEVQALFERVKAANPDLMTAGGAESRMFRDLLEKPETLVDEIVRWAPSGIFVSTFLGMWICLFLVMRNALVWKQKVEYPYYLRDLLEFKVADWVIWPVIAALGLYVGGEQLIGANAEVIGGNALYCLGVFYFFQGFGVFSDLLTFLRIHGILRSLLVVTTVMAAWRFVAVAGVFDMWFNFRRFFTKKKNDEGDTL